MQFRIGQSLIFGYGGYVSVSNKLPAAELLRILSARIAKEYNPKKQTTHARFPSD